MTNVLLNRLYFFYCLLYPVGGDHVQKRDRIEGHICKHAVRHMRNMHTQNPHKQLVLTNYKRMPHGTSAFDKTNIMNIHQFVYSSHVR